ncbi:hypothetical protein [Streptomyces sp. NPDC005012]|uniref:hypothetical protein n=1 Tax=unclassified Streptomyces TaxID=2593676 RepID=UPI00339EA0CF
MPSDPSVLRLMAVLAVLVLTPLSLALGLRALELAGLLRTARRGAGPVDAGAVDTGAVDAVAVVRLAPGPAPRRTRVGGLRGAVGFALGSVALAACAALAVLTAVRGQA